MNENKRRKRGKDRMHNLFVGVGATGFFILLIVYGFWMDPAGTAGTSGETTEKGKEQTMEITITKDNFEAEVLKSDKLVLVDFWAPWCGPCRMLAPFLAEIAEEKGDKIKVGKVNVDEEPDLAAKYGISGIPAILLFKNGQVVDTSVGFVPKQNLDGFISKHIH